LKGWKFRSKCLFFQGFPFAALVRDFCGFGGVFELPGRQKGDINALSPEGNPTMPYIKLRKHADGSLRYTAIVRIRRSGKMLHQEAKTFPTDLLLSGGVSIAKSPWKAPPPLPARSSLRPS
jgi:hypothetical protein